MDKKYISRVDALKEIRDTYEFEYPTASGAFDEFVTMLIPRILKNLPAADVIEVVRCKDCKCYEEMKSENACFCNKFGGYVTEHDYCSRAEKKEGAEE